MARQRTKTTEKKKPTVFGRTAMYEAVGVLVKEQGLRRGQLERAVRATFQAITTALAKGQRVTLPGFGTFYASKRPTATVRLPDGTPKKVPAHRVPRFRPGAVLKRTVAGR